MVVQEIYIIVHLVELHPAVGEHGSQNIARYPIAALDHRVDRLLLEGQRIDYRLFGREGYLYQLLIERRGLEGIAAIVKIYAYDIIELALHKRIHRDIIHGRAVVQALAVYHHRAVIKRHSHARLQVIGIAPAAHLCEVLIQHGSLLEVQQRNKKRVRYLRAVVADIIDALLQKAAAQDAVDIPPVAVFTDMLPHLLRLIELSAHKGEAVETAHRRTAYRRDLLGINILAYRLQRADLKRALCHSARKHQTDPHIDSLPSCTISSYHIYHRNSTSLKRKSNDRYLSHCLFSIKMISRRKRLRPSCRRRNQ